MFSKARFTSDVGGLVGDGQSTTISSSSAVMNKLNGISSGGGLVGFIDTDGRSISISTKINYSLAITHNITFKNSNAGGLVGRIITAPIIANSYWDNRTVFGGTATITTSGTDHSTANLQAPTNTTGFPNTIYADWANAYCNPTTGEYIEVAAGGTAPDASLGFQRAWDLGDADEYPALTCFPNLLDPAEQREVAAAALAGRSPFDAYNNLPSKRQ